MIKHYLAPLEGITGYIFRNAVLEYFGQGIDKVYAPFIMPHIKIPMSKKDIEDICPEHNAHGKLVPQILTNEAEGFMMLEKAMRDYGYDEINLNLGCPSKTVTGKGRGAGFLKYTTALDDFLYQIYENAAGKISIKTRIGDDDPEEFYKLLEIYNKYPVYELTIHPRLKTQAYNGKPYLEHYLYAQVNSKNPVCYNGDINSPWDAQRLVTMSLKKEKPDNHPLRMQDTGTVSYEDADLAIMIGRGMIRNPAFIRQLTTKEKVTSHELATFLLRLREEYSQIFSGDTPVLFKMKEIWSYMRDLYPDNDRDIRKMLKSKTLKEYSMYEKMIFTESQPHIPC